MKVPLAAYPAWSACILIVSRAVIAIEASLSCSIVVHWMLIIEILEHLFTALHVRSISSFNILAALLMAKS